MNTVARKDAETPELPVVLAEFLAALRGGDHRGQVAATAWESGYRLGLEARPS